MKQNKIPSPNQEVLDLQKELDRLANQAFKIAGKMAGIRHKIEHIRKNNRRI
jgi:peptidoglycan hydrolase CwlO-like protein